MPIDLGKYICAYIYFGFKRLFGSERNKDILISFLNGSSCIFLYDIKSIE